MPYEKAKSKAEILQKFAKHPLLVYTTVQISERQWAVAQYFDSKQVALINV